VMRCCICACACGLYLLMCALLSTLPNSKRGKGAGRLYLSPPRPAACLTDACGRFDCGFDRRLTSDF
jgi:hypothetical protein